MPLCLQIMHRRAEFAAGTGTLPPAGNGVAPTRISPMLPQTQILKDTRHRRDAYARGVGDIPPPPPKVVLEPTLSSDSADSLVSCEHAELCVPACRCSVGALVSSDSAGSLGQAGLLAVYQLVHSRLCWWASRGPAFCFL